MFLITLLLVIIIILFIVYLNILYSHKELPHFKFNVCINKDQNVNSLKNVIKGDYVKVDPLGVCSYDCDPNLEVQSGVTNIDLINRAAGKPIVRGTISCFVTPIFFLLLAVILVSNKEGAEEFLEKTDFGLQEWLEEDNHSIYIVLFFMLLIIVVTGVTYHLSQLLNIKINSYMKHFKGEINDVLETLKNKLLFIGHAISTLILITAVLLIYVIVKSIDR